MAINVGSVYLSSYIDSRGMERGISNVQAVAKSAFDSVSIMITQTASLVEPIINGMSVTVADRTAEAISCIGGITQYVSGDFSKEWNKAWDGVGVGFQGIWRGVASFFTGIINAMVDGINTVLGGLNRISIKMPEWLGNGSFGFNLPLLSNIPQMAKGGVVSQPTLAMVGERGREAVMPLENNTAWITDLANQLGAVMSANGTIGSAAHSSGGGVVNLYVDGKKLAEATIDDFAQVSNRRGIRVLGMS